MKNRIIILLMIATLLGTAFGSQYELVKAEYSHPRLYFSYEDIPRLKALKDAPSHSTIWNNILTWANDHIDNEPPGEMLDKPWDYRDYMTSYIRMYIENMIFVYYMTDDTNYADAAEVWLLDLLNWTKWGHGDNIQSPDHWQILFNIAHAVSFGIDALSDYISEEDRAALVTELISSVGEVYDEFSSWKSPDWDSKYPDTLFVIGGGIGMSGLALLEDYEDAQDWIDYGVSLIQRGLGYYGTDGATWGGCNYQHWGLEGVAPFLYALNRIQETDLIGDYFKAVPRKFVYFTYNDYGLQFGNYFWGINYLGYNLIDGYHVDRGIAYLYLFSAAAEDEYGQWLADTYAAPYRMAAYLWKDPSLSSTAPDSSLSQTHFFDDNNYVVWRTGWGDEDLLFAFKSGKGYGHAHASQNSFGIYYGGVPITCGAGYWQEAPTWAHNCMLVDGAGQSRNIAGEILTATDNTPYYRYLLGDATASYKGALDKWYRHVVFVENPNYFVMYDEVAASEEKQFDWLLHAPYLAGGYGSVPTLSVNGDLITLTGSGGGELKVKIVEPQDFNYEIIPYRNDQSRQCYYIKVRPSTDKTAAQFLTVFFPDSVLFTNQVAVGNLRGVEVVDGTNIDLILFSQDGNPVNEYIELGDYYQAADGNTYTFNGTQVLASFDTYQVMRLEAQTTGNHPPVLSTIGNKSVTTGQTLQFTVSATDPNGDALTYSASNLPSGATFTPSTRTFSWTPTSSQVGSYPNVRFTVSDGTLTDYENITITVSAPPVPISLPLRVNAGGSEYSDSLGNAWVADQAYVAGSWGFYGADNTVDRGTGYAISGTVDDRIYQTERYGLSGYRFGLENGTYDVVLHFAETYSGITGPGQRVFDVFIEGQLVLDNFDIYSEAGYSTALKKVFNNIVVQDGQLNITFASSIGQPEINGIEILLAGGNNAPVLDTIGNKSVTEGESLTFTVTATDPDDDPLTFSANNLPEGASFNPTTRTFSWTPTASQVGSYPDVHFEVSDGELTDSEDITITVLSADNSAPVLNEIGNKSVREGNLLEFTISATDPDDDPLTFSASNLPAGATFDPETMTFSWTPALGQRGNYFNVRFNVTDGALSDYEYIKITVIPNNKPVLGSIGNKSVREKNKLEFTVSATDPDDDPLTFSADNLPDGASFDPETMTFSWTPTSSQIGTYEDIHFEVSDGTFIDYEDITITVLSLGNNAPGLGEIGDRLVEEGELLEFTVSATDPDDDPLTFSADNLPDGASFDPETMTFSWTPEPGQEGEYPNIRFEVSDGELTDFEEITITVTIPTPPGGGGGGDVSDDNPGGGGGGTVGGGSAPPSNEPPVLDEIGDRSVEEGELLEFTVSATDPDDDPLTFSADNLPDGASFDPETMTFSWTPEPGQEGEYLNIRFEVSDGELTDFEEITITVTIPTPPVIEEVTTSDVGTDSAVIRWMTTEPSTSQVEYWASPSQFSPLDETLVTEHEVYLTGLRPGTNYHYRTISQDKAGNLVTSPEYNFTTSGKPAAFVVNWLTISPAEASVGQEVTTNALITNTGDVAGSYDVTLSINGTVEATENIVDLAGRASQVVTFTITRETAGVYTVNVNGTMGTLVINDEAEPEAAISLFSITPNYESDTGIITFTRIDYGIYESYYSTLFSQPDIELILKVGLYDEPLEEVTLIASGQSQLDMSTGSLNYTPAEGWTSGTYTFQAELRTGEGVIESSPPIRLIITPAAAASVATWATLGEIIGGALIIALLVVLLILHRNRDMLRTQSLE